MNPIRIKMARGRGGEADEADEADEFHIILPSSFNLFFFTPFNLQKCQPV